MKKVFSCADILIPKNIDMQAWCVVACDQHTSNKQYWLDVKNLVGNKPSTLNLIVPEVYLKEDIKSLIKNANNEMINILNSNIMQLYTNSIIYVERNLSNGKTRKGIIGKIDLEEYSIDIESNAKIKPSEQIVESRVPTRVAIRKNASLDLPHILLFCDDNKKEIIELLSNDLNAEQKVYDFNLNMNGGRITGYRLSERQVDVVENKINSLISKGNTGLIVADGNHSLVSAKRVYEEIKESDPNYLNSPKRYALVEIVNVYDNSIDIEPIHRIIKNVDCDDFLNSIKKELSINNDNNKKTIKIVFKNNEIILPIKTKKNQLEVEVVQDFLDRYLKEHNCEIDYIHEYNKLIEMSRQNNMLGIVFSPIEKADIFKVISNKKLFPRKTFSIGSSLDKRYYLESRKLI